MINKMKIKRGTLITDQCSNVVVRTVGFIYRLNILSMIDKTYNINQNVLGVILENKYCLCHRLNLRSGESYFGYTLNNTFSCTAFRFQLIQDFREEDHHGVNL